MLNYSFIFNIYHQSKTLLSCRTSCGHMALWVFFCFIGTSQLAAQPLDSLLALIDEYNPQLRALQLDYQAASNLADQIAVYPDPEVSLGLGVQPVETRLGPQEIRLGVSQRLLWKGQLDAQREWADALAEVKAHNSDNARIELALLAKKAYARLIFLNEKEPLLYQMLDILNALEDLAKATLESGKGRLSDLLLIQRKRDEVESSLATLEILKEGPRILINRVTGRPLDTPVGIDPSSFLREPTLQSVLVKEDYPTFMTIQNQKDASRKMIELTRFQSKPKVMVGLDYIVINSRPAADILDNGRDAIMPMGRVSLPLSTKQYKAKREEEKVKMESLDWKIRQLKDLYEAEIAQAIVDYRTSEVQINNLFQLIETTSSVIELLQTDYANAGIRFEELLQYEIQQIQYRIDIFKAEEQQRIAQAILEKYAQS